MNKQWVQSIARRAHFVRALARENSTVRRVKHVPHTHQQYDVAQCCKHRTHGFARLLGFCFLSHLRCHAHGRDLRNVYWHMYVSCVRLCLFFSLMSEYKELRAGTGRSTQEFQELAGCRSFGQADRKHFGAGGSYARGTSLATGAGVGRPMFGGAAGEQAHDAFPYAQPAASAQMRGSRQHTPIRGVHKYSAISAVRWGT